MRALWSSHADSDRRYGRSTGRSFGLTPAAKLNQFLSNAESCNEQEEGEEDDNRASKLVAAAATENTLSAEKSAKVGPRRRPAHIFARRTARSLTQKWLRTLSLMIAGTPSRSSSFIWRAIGCSGAASSQLAGLAPSQIERHYQIRRLDINT